MTLHRVAPGFSFQRWLTPSLLSLFVNLPLVLSGLPLASFDAYTHIFFADHYRRWWFDLFEPRWFGGFSGASYPPLTHQLIALMSFPASTLAGLWDEASNVTRYRGEAIGYGLLLLIVLVCLPVSVRRFATIFVPARAARLAGWLAVGLPSIYLTAYSFGQLPTLAASTVLMWALAEGWRYGRTGHWRDLVSAVLWAGVTAAAHHAVLLFALTMGGTIAGHGLLRARTTATTKFFFFRLIIWATVAGVFAAIVIWPFIQWSWGYSPQWPIDHASRHNFFADWLAGYYFFWPMYGPLLLVLPLMGWLARRKRRHWPLLGASLLLFILGLGGTTPLPWLLFGANWAWLTYDRFSLWAGLTLLPFAGLLCELYRLKMGRFFVWRTALSLTLAAFCIYGAFAAQWLQAQPPAVDVVTIARFLNDPARVGNRYLTFGFGDQLAKLSVLTAATTIDGTYFTARSIPELRYSGLGTLDGVMWNPTGVDGARPFLARATAWQVEWVFTAHPKVVEMMTDLGWQSEGEIVPGVMAWHNPTPISGPIAEPPHKLEGGTATWWGIVPLLTLGLALLLTIADRAYTKFVSLLSLSLLLIIWPFWYYLLLWSLPHPGVYFTYTSGLIFPADVLAGILVVLMELTPQVQVDRRYFFGASLARPTVYYLLIILFALLSSLTSIDPALSLEFALHLILMGLVAWAVARARPMLNWRFIAYALTIGLMIQSVIAVMQVVTQTTSWLMPLGLTWPGSLTAETIGASVVGLADGTRWLRAYGTLPHPNLLAGYLLVGLAGPGMGYLQTGQRRWLWPLALGGCVLTLTFSRAGWLGGIAFLITGLVLLSDKRRWGRVAATLALSAAAMAIVLSPLFLTRVTASVGSPQEAFSITDRIALLETAITFIVQHPLTGVGAGGFVPTLTKTLSLTPEPVHNVPLLVAAEIGVGGGLAVIALGVALLWQSWRQRQSWRLRQSWGLPGGSGPILSAVISGLMVMALFDHFLWSVSAGRLLAAVVVGMWAGAEAGTPPRT